MLIKTLVENTSISQDFGSEHGLSIYVETKHHKILFDVGASALFLQNAKKLDVDISDINFLVISHGHYDHGGGLEVFLQKNNKAKVYLQQQAFEKYYVLHSTGKPEFIGLDESLQHNKRIMLVTDDYTINEGLRLFVNKTQTWPQPKANGGLLIEHQGQMTDDNFIHEQNLVVEENGKILLITGCAHNGIVNILEHFYFLKGRMPDYVIGGFHLFSRSVGNENPAVIDQIGKYLMDTKTKFYTCHCTGLKAYKRLKSIMGNKIDYLSAGSEITI
ncbi:MAG: MBL fold metallo-hydrolase [Bacillota bacterium]|jgi:7,8-dihydropterin-6-yl-methyl-4-(beta-D-ribofuranosyl)aminobenzene 5'-phosphate synthase